MTAHMKFESEHHQLLVAKIGVLFYHIEVYAVDEGNLARSFTCKFHVRGYSK